jgi:hypothetical protein
MSDSESKHGRRKPWSEWSVRAKVGMILGAAVAVPGLLALCGAVTMWLWNWLMPEIFRLPAIGFWQAIGILVLAQILFKGGHGAHAGRRQWKKRQVWKHMQEDAPAGPTA